MIYGNKYYEAQKYLILTGHLVHKNTAYMRTSLLKGLSDNDQEIIKESIYEAGRYNDKLMQEHEKEMLNKLRDEGMIIIEPDLEAFRDKAMRGIEDWLNEAQLEFFNAIKNMP